MGSGAGIGQKPDDWRCVPLCGQCHNGEQHTKLGEPEFWARYETEKSQTVEQLIEELSKASPRAAQIRQVKRERDNG